MAPGEEATKLFTAAEPATSLGGVADFPVNAACMKYLFSSLSFIPQTILRNVVRSGEPGLGITGATALPVSHRLRSERKSFFNSAALKLSTGFELLTMTTMASPAWTGGGATRHKSRISAAARVKIGFFRLIICRPRT